MASPSLLPSLVLPSDGSSEGLAISLPPLSTIQFHINNVIQEEGYSVPLVLPSDGSSEGLAISQGLGGTEGVVSECVITRSQLPSIPLNLTLVTISSLRYLESLPLGSGMVDLQVEMLAQDVIYSHIHLSHPRSHLLEDGGAEDVKLVRFVVSGDLHIEYIGTVLIHLGLYMELVKESILVYSVHHELKVTGPRPEGCQELVLAHHSPIQD